jgi:hypothetical protein
VADNQIGTELALIVFFDQFTNFPQARGIVDWR